MIWRQQKWFVWSELILAWLVLLALIFYTYVELVDAPYLGFNFQATTGRVNELFVADPATTLRVGDELRGVNGQSFALWQDDLRAVLFPRVAAGDVLTLDIQRGDASMAVAWRVAGFNWGEFRRRALNAWWMGYFFWAAGQATLLFVRPYDLKRSLFAAFFFFTAIWLVAGNTSRWGIGESRVIYRMALCLSVAVMLHLHWLFPRPLARLPWGVWLAVYAAAVAASLYQLAPNVAPEMATLTFAATLPVCVLLLVAHYWFQPEVRPQVRLLVFALVFAVIPILAVAVAATLRTGLQMGNYGLLALPVIPGVYFYSIYRYQLGGIEFRANRVIAVYLYLILLGTALLIGTAMLSSAPDFADSAVLVVSLLGMAEAVLTIYGFPHFRRAVERHLLAMPLPPVHLLETYLARITTTLNEPSLVQLLKDEVMPSLLVRQAALLRIHNQEATLIFSTAEALPREVIAHFLAKMQTQSVYHVVDPTLVPPRNWVRLALALQVEGRLIGMWLLGRHDPDDQFSAVDLATLQTLARQTALALANIEQAAQLQALYQASIERQEQERMKMAHFLHDAILNSAAVMYMSLDAAALSPRVEAAYATLKEQIHQMVSNLRPPSLDFGLAAALEEFVVELDQRMDDTAEQVAAGLAETQCTGSDDLASLVSAQATVAVPGASSNVNVELRLQVPMARLDYPPQVENHIFRIVQQACENALRHAYASTIRISGTLAPDRVEVTVEDDGVGFVIDKPLNISNLLAHKHYGLVHMIERAEHIHAELALDSAPGCGTRVRLAWHDPAPASPS